MPAASLPSPSRKPLAEVYHLANGAVALAVQRVAKPRCINRGKLAGNKIPFGFLDHGLAGGAGIRPGFVGLYLPPSLHDTPRSVMRLKPGEANKVALEALACGPRVCKVGTATHRLAHHIDAKSELSLSRSRRAISSAKP